MSEIFSREQAKASDHRLYDLMMAVARAQQDYDGALTSIHHFVKDEHPRRYDARSGWKLSDQEAVDKLAAQVRDAALPSYLLDDAKGHLRRLAERMSALAEAQDAQAVQEREWAEHGRWPRYSVVPGGHIHSDMGCFTFHRGLQRTDVRWAYPVSGDTVEDAIAVYGEALCTHCYPDAPVAKTWDTIGMDAEGNPMTKAERQAIKDARAAEKAAALAAKNSAAIIDPVTGAVLFKTERAAKNAVLARAKDALFYEMDHPSQDEWRAEALATIDALVAKGLIERDAYVAEVAAKVAKAQVKDLKNWREHWMVQQLIRQGREVETPAYAGKTWQDLAPLIEAWLA